MLALVAAWPRSHRSRGRDRGAREEAGHVAERGGQLVRLPARVEVDPRARDRRTATTSRTRRPAPAAGIAAITARTVDFGASDAPLSPDQISGVQGLCRQIPWALSATSIAVQPAGRRTASSGLTGRSLASIYLGEITSWNDAAIKKLNPKCTLPDTKITPVYRSDGSGTTYNFTDYLSACQPGVEVEARVGVRRVSGRPASGASGSSGVAGVVTKTEGAISYVDVAYSIAEQVPVRLDEERAGQVRDAGPPRDPGGGVAAAEEDHRATARSRSSNPPKGRPARLPDRRRSRT